MSSLAVQHNAINLGQGFPDYPMSEELISLVDEAMRSGYNQYTHMNGYPPLREAIAEKINYLYQHHVGADEEITITPGGTYALFTALTTILQPGDEVIVFEPAYDSYIPAIELNGAKAITIDLTFPDYRINWTKVAQTITERTKAIIINTPHNPTGSVMTEEDMRQLEQLVSGKEIFIISDEVYEHLIFDDLPHHSVLRYPELFSRSFVCFSFGKVYNCTGWKIGYCVSPAALMKEFRKVHQFNCFTCDTPKQVALATFLRHREQYLSLGKVLQQKRDHFSQLMASTKLKALPSYGSYFQCYSYKHLSDESEMDFAKRLTVDHGVTTIPVSAFYRSGADNGVLRFCFSKKESTLQSAVERLVKL